MPRKKNLYNRSEKLAAHVANRLEKLLSPKIIGVEVLRRGIYELLHDLRESFSLGAPKLMLTKQQSLILKLTAEGTLSGPEIAKRLDLSIRTIESHRRAVQRKIGCSTVVGLTRYAIATGIVPVKYQRWGPSSGRAKLNLTPRQLEILTLTAGGFSSPEIASKLDIGLRSVEAHRTYLGQRIGCSTAVGLTRYAVATGIIPVKFMLWGHSK